MRSSSLLVNPTVIAPLDTSVHAPTSCRVDATTSGATARISLTRPHDERSTFGDLHVRPPRTIPSQAASGLVCHGPVRERSAPAARCLHS
jgi:hypothetical protein